MTAQINWWRGDPALLRAKYLATQRELGSIRGIAGGARGLAQFLWSQDQQAKQRRANLARVMARAGVRTNVEGPQGTAPAEALAQQQSAGDLKPTYDVAGFENADPSQPAEGMYAEPTTVAINEPGKTIPGRGTAGTPPGEGTGTQGVAPFAADLDPISRAVRWMGSKAGLMAPAAPGPSAVQRAAGLEGQWEARQQQTKEMQALAPLLRGQRRPMQAAAAMWPGHPGMQAAARAGGGRAPDPQDMQMIDQLTKLAQAGDQNAKVQLMALFDQLLMLEGYPVNVDLRILPDTSTLSKAIEAQAISEWREGGQAEDFAAVRMRAQRQYEQWRREIGRRGGTQTIGQVMDARTGEKYLNQQAARDAGVPYQYMVDVRTSVSLTSEEAAAVKGRGGIPGQGDLFEPETSVGGFPLTKPRLR